MGTVLVTGAGRGLGLALVKEHRKLGDQVFAWDCRMTEELAEASKDDKDIVVREADIASTDSVNKAAEDVKALSNNIDIVYNNAGIYYKGFHDEGRREIIDYDFDSALDMYTINSVGAFRVVKALLKLDLLHSGATVCITSSEAGSVGGSPNFRTSEYTYCMSKAALNKGATLLYNDIGRKGMRVICFHPGWMKTQMGGAGAIQPPENTARAFMKYTLDFNSTSRENMFMKFDGTPLGW